MRPVRSREDALEAAQARVTAREAHRRLLMLGGAGNTAAATLRQQGRIKKPRVVWVNRDKVPGDKG
jgi:hypothetical protein